MELKVDQNKCTGCGTCIALCPEVFEFDEGGKSRVVNEKGCEQGCDCQRVVEVCPVGAISLSE